MSNPQNETPTQFRQRMEAAHDLMSKVAALQASLYKLWELEETGEWDMKGTLGERLLDLYDLTNKVQHSLLHETEVSFYG